MTISTSGFVRNSRVGQTTCTLQLGADVLEGDAIVLGVSQRTDDSTDVSSVADPVNGTWPVGAKKQGLTDDPGAPTSHATWIYVLENSAALTGTSNRTITVTFAGAVNAMLIGGILTADGTLSYDGVATVLQTSTSETVYSSNDLAVSAAGGIVGFLYVNNSQNADPTGETSLVTYTSDPGDGITDGRTMMFYKAVAGGSSYGFDATINDAARGNFHVVSLVESSSSSAPKAAAFYRMLHNA